MFLPMIHQMLAYVSGLAEGGRVRAEIAGPKRAPGLYATGGITRVVNVDPFESETARCTPAEFAKRLEFRPPALQPARSPAPDREHRYRRRGKLRGDELLAHCSRSPSSAACCSKTSSPTARRPNPKGTPVSHSTLEPVFLNRFEQVWTLLRREQVRQGLCYAFLTGSLGFALVTAADYVGEISWAARASGLAIASVLVLVVLWQRVVAPLRWWTRPRTAAEIEEQFPQLGQRIRTVISSAKVSQWS